MRRRSDENERRRGRFDLSNLMASNRRSTSTASAPAHGNTGASSLQDGVDSSTLFPRLQANASAHTRLGSGGSLYPSLEDMPTSVRSFLVEDEPPISLLSDVATTTTTTTASPSFAATTTAQQQQQQQQQAQYVVSSPSPKASPVVMTRERKFSHDPPGSKEETPSHFHYPPQLGHAPPDQQRQQEQNHNLPNSQSTRPGGQYGLSHVPSLLAGEIATTTTTTAPAAARLATVENSHHTSTTNNSSATFYTGTPSRKGVSLEDDDPQANSMWDAHQQRLAAVAKHSSGTPAAQAAATVPIAKKPSLIDEDDEDNDDPENTDEAKDRVPPIMFQPHLPNKRQVSLKKPPPATASSSGNSNANNRKPNHHSQAPPVKTTLPKSVPAPNSPVMSVPKLVIGGPSSSSSPHGQQRPGLTSSPSGISTISALTTSIASLAVEPLEPGGTTTRTDRRDVPSEPSPPPAPVVIVKKSGAKKAVATTETEEETQLRLAKEASLQEAQKSSGGSSSGGGGSSSINDGTATKEESVPDDMLETARENARTLQSICRQGQEGTVDPSILEYYLNMCTQDQERISSSSSVGSLDIDKVEKILAVNDMLLTAIEIGQEHKKSTQKKAPPSKSDSLAIASLVAKKDIFSLICMLRAQDENQRLEAALALMHFARKAEQDKAPEEDRRLRNEIISSGGLHSLLTLYRSRSSMYELKVVVALAIAYLMSSSSLLKPGLKPGLGVKIMECLRFLSQGRDVSPRGERIAKEESFRAAAIGLANFWMNQLDPLLRSQGGELPALLRSQGELPTAGVDHLGRLSRRGRSAPGHVFDQRKEAIGTQELLEMTVSLIIEFASRTSAVPSTVASDPVLLVEQICAVEAARPIAVREGVLKILVGWIQRDGNGRNRLAAAISLLNLTRIKDKYMAGWIHSQMVNEGALPAIARLTRDESIGPQVRLAIAKILSSLCVAPHTRAAVVEADCIHFLVDILFEHVTSEEVALFASQALMQLAAGAITRASALGADGVQSNAFVSPDKRDKVIDDIIERGAIGSLVEIALQHKGQLRAVAIESLRVLSEDISPRRQTRLKLCDDRAALAIGTMLMDMLPSVESALEREMSVSSDTIYHLHEGLCALSNLLDPLTGTLNSTRTRNSRQVSNPRDPNQMLITACFHIIESGGLDSLIRIALFPVDSTNSFGPHGISILDLLAEACQSIGSLSPLFISKEISQKRLSCWASDVLMTFDYLLHTLSQYGDKSNDALNDIRVSALQGISALAGAAPLQIRIIDRLLSPLLEAKNSQDQRDIANASAQALQSLDLAEDEVAHQVAGNSASLLADWFCLQRSLLIQAMARHEIRDTVMKTWEAPFKENVPSTGPTRLVREVSDRSKSDDDKSMGSYFFDNVVSDDIPLKKINSILQQYNDMFGCERPSGSHRAILDKKAASSTSQQSGLLHSQIYPLGDTHTETDWLLRHHDYLQTGVGDCTTLSDHVTKLLSVCFPSQLIRDHVVPMTALRPDASFNFRALMMPQRRYFSFRREGQLLSRICGKDDEPENIDWTLGFTNSSFAGEFAESLVQALYLCPMVRGLSFTRNHQWYNVKQLQEDGEPATDDGVGLIANIVGSLPPWIANLTFDGLLGENEFRSLVKILDTMGKLSASQATRGSPLKESILDPEPSFEDAKDQGRFWCFAVRNSPHMPPEIWQEFFSQIGKVGRAMKSPSRRPLSSLKALDLSGNGLNDDLCASLLELVLDKDAGCQIEQVDLSRNRLANATLTLQVIRNYVQLHRTEQHRGKAKMRKQGWSAPLHTLLLASTGVHLGGAWLELITLLKHNALSLKCLDLSANKISLKGNSYEAETFFSCLQKNTYLVHLNLSGNFLSPDTIDDLIARLGGSAVEMGLSFVDLSLNQPPLTGQQESMLNSFCSRSRSTLVQRMVSEKEESSRFSVLGTSTLSISYAANEFVTDAPSGYDPDREPSTFNQTYTSDSGNRTQPRALSDNMITVLFSAPLVYKDRHSNLKPFAKLDFDMERELIMQCLKEASRDIDLSFDTATHHRLLAAISKGCSCLHYSGHGHEKFLPFEDGQGGPHWFEVDNIKSLIAGREGGPPFRFVFVSACYSGLAGETFASAGVPHVVCCKQQFELKDTAALAFTRQFYLALAVGHTVKESFEQGRKAVRATPNLRDADSETEKFILLPRDGNHNVPIFDAKPTLQWPHASSYRKRKQKKAALSIFNKMQEDPSTSPPQFFLGREVDMYLVLNLVLEKRLVSVVGETGMGRSSLVCALCHYINERATTINQIEHILYVKARQTRKQTRVRALVQKLMKRLVDSQKIDPEEADAGPDVDIESLFDIICRGLRDTKCLIVFDRTELLKDSDETREFPMLLSNLFRETRHVRVLLTGREPLGIPSIGGQVEHHFCLGPLTYSSTVRLFSCLCPYIHTPIERRRLCSILGSDGAEAEVLSSDPGLSDTIRRIFSLLGNGVPALIEKAAYVMTKDDVMALMTGATIPGFVGEQDV